MEEELSPSDRRKAILFSLQDESIVGDELARRMGCSLRTIYRDIKILRETYTIAGGAGSGGGYIWRIRKDNGGSNEGCPV